jgi:predicted acyl esterase
MGGPVVMTEYGPDPVRGILTFTSAPLEEELAIAGPMELVVHASSSRTDMNVIARLAEQFPQAEAERASGRQPNACLVTKGWLRASHRVLDDGRSAEGSPFHQHSEAHPLTPDVPVELRVALMPCAHRFRRGSRIRLEISCGDSTLTDQHFAHAFTPDMVGTDTLYHGAAYPSRLLLPVIDEQIIRFAAGS